MFFLIVFLSTAKINAQEQDFEFYKNHIYLNGMLNGKPVNLVFDSGADFLYVDSTYLACGDFEFKNTQNARMGGAGTGGQNVKIIIKEVLLELGGQTYKPPYTPIINLRAILGNKADGLFGLKGIADKVVTIDFKDSKMAFRDPLSEEMRNGYTMIPIDYSSNRILVPIEVTIKSNMNVTGKALMDLGSGQSIEFTSKTAADYGMNNIEGKTPFHYDNGGIGGQSDGYDFKIENAKIGGMSVNNDSVRYSTDKTGALSDRPYIAIVGNKVWRQFNIIIDMKGKKLYLKKNAL